MTDGLPYSKATQLERSAGKRYYCDTTGQYKGNCPCKSCIGRRSRGKGKRAERSFRKGRGLKISPAAAAVGEEAFGDTIRWEIKAGARMANPVGMRYLKCEEQAEAAKAIGDVRPFAAVFKPDGYGDELIVVRRSKFTEVAKAWLGYE